MLYPNAKISVHSTPRPSLGSTRFGSVGRAVRGSDSTKTRTMCPMLVLPSKHTTVRLICHSNAKKFGLAYLSAILAEWGLCRTMPPKRLVANSTTQAVAARRSIVIGISCSSCGGLCFSFRCNQARNHVSRRAAQPTFYRARQCEAGLSFRLRQVISSPTQPVQIAH